jgi:hypothetical protein
MTYLTSEARLIVLCLFNSAKYYANHFDAETDARSSYLPSMDEACALGRDGDDDDIRHLLQ